MDEIIHTNFESSQGVKIDVTYLVRDVPSQGEHLYSAHVKISIEGMPPMVTPESKVSAVLINHYQAYGNGDSGYQKVWTIDLLPTWRNGDGTLFSGMLANPLEIAHYWRDGHEIHSYSPQVAVVIDGVWQQDPWQAPGYHNFNFEWQID